MKFVKEWALPISLGLNVILAAALFFLGCAALVSYGLNKQYEGAFDAKMLEAEKEGKKLNPCEPCEKCPTKEEVRKEVLKEIVEGDIIKASLPKETAKLLFPESENKSIELSSQ